MPIALLRLSCDSETCVQIAAVERKWCLMSCCAAAEFALAMSDPRSATDEVLLASRIVGEGIRQTDLSVPRIHCGGCIQKVEASLRALPGVEDARVNLS